MDNSIEHQTPGKVLLSKREQLGLTTKDAACALKLSELFIVAMDSDNYEDGPDAAYVRGYLRLYARLLDLDEDMVVSLYNKMPNKAKNTSFDTSFVTTKDTKAQKKYLNMMIISLVVVISGVWFVSKKFNPKSDILAKDDFSAPDVVTSLDIEDEITKPDASKIETNAIEETAKLSDTKKPQSEQLAIVEEETLLGDVIALDKEITKNDDTAINYEQYENLEITNDDEAVINVSDEIITVSDNIIGRTSNLGFERQFPSLIELNFTEDCWVSIRDANNRKLAFGVMRGGKKISLRGREPINVVLGNAWAVDFKFNGKKIDTTGYTPNQVGKFILSSKRS